MQTLRRSVTSEPAMACCLAYGAGIPADTKVLLQQVYQLTDSFCRILYHVSVGA